MLQVLIFSQMTSILDILMDYCFLRGFEYSRLDGSMAFADREENVSVQILLPLYWLVSRLAESVYSHPTWEMYVE